MLVCCVADWGCEDCELEPAEELVAPLSAGAEPVPPPDAAAALIPLLDVGVELATVAIFTR